MRVNALAVAMVATAIASFSATAADNVRTCLDGKYHSLCDYSLLTTEQRARAVQARRRENLKTCLSGRYTSLCDHSLLDDVQVKATREAERRENLKTCLSGKYVSLCNHGRLSSTELVKVREAERHENLKVCLNGSYPNLCNHALLSADERAQVATAETNASRAVKQQSPKGTKKRSSGKCYEAGIQKPTPFLGNGGEVIVLDDGTIWEEVSYQYLYLYEYYPTVIVCPARGIMILDDNKFQIVPIR